MKHFKWLIFLLLLVVLTAPIQNVFADVTYVVKPGDTLSSIAHTYGVTVAAIVAANNIEDPNFIKAGQELIIPGVDGPAEPTGGNSGSGSSGSGSSGGGNTTVPAGGTIYTVQPGDSLSKIAGMFGVTVAAIAEANNIEDINLIHVGQELIIPGSSGGGTTTPAPITVPTPVPAPGGNNLLPNPSFEAGYYNLDAIEELQVPDGWLMEVDRGNNYLLPDSGTVFFQPESRIFGSNNIPEHERALLIWNGDKAIKVFKGGGPISFRLFTDIYLTPGRYRFTVNLFADFVMAYNEDGTKEYATDLLSGEIQFIQGSGGSAWMSPPLIGAKNTMTYEFTVNSSGTVRLGVGFRNRYSITNNGWFLDDWSLVKIQ